MSGQSEVDAEIIIGLINLIYECVTDSSRWPRFLEAFVHAVRATGGSLALRDTSGTDFSGVCWYGWTDEEMRLYNEHYFAIDRWADATVRCAEGTVATDFEICPREETEAGRAFRN
jgi:hypothetical protein